MQRPILIVSAVKRSRLAILLFRGTHNSLQAGLLMPVWFQSVNVDSSQHTQVHSVPAQTRRLQSALKMLNVAKSSHVTKTFQLTATTLWIQPKCTTFLIDYTRWRAPNVILILSLFRWLLTQVPRASSGSVLYLSPSMMGIKLASQGFYPGTVAGIELTQRLPRSSWRSIKRSRKCNWGTEDNTGGWQEQWEWKETAKNRWGRKQVGGMKGSSKGEGRRKTEVWSVGVV